MSRIGRLPIVVPKGVTVQVAADQVLVSGPKGSLRQAIVSGTSVEAAGDTITINRSSDEGPVRAAHGLMRALVMNMVTGVSTGFAKALDIQGVGFRAEIKGPNLVMNLGFSHPIEYAVPKGVAVEVQKSTRVVVTGSDRQQVGQVAAEIRAYRPPDHYKGKGVRYENEHPRIKEGKSA